MAIHAGKRADPPDAATLDDFARLGITLPARLDYGAIVAVVNVVDCVRLEDLPAELRDDPFAEGPFVWILADARPVEPIPCKGKLGLWDAPDSVK